MTLYEIDERLRLLEEYMVDADTGEVLSEEDFNIKLDEIQMALTDKISNTMCFYKNLIAEADAIKAEEKKLAERRKSKENLAERLKKRIDDYISYQYTNEDGYVDIENLNKYKFEDAKVRLSYRKSESVDVDLDILPKKYIKKKVELSADKNELKKLLKEGNKIKGAELVTNLNLQVK